ncbi:MAG: DUF4157 domain-containing protein [Dongiaceae bacterium]
MEPRFGRDLGHVRVHADAGAARSARRIDAVAYTAGRDIVFGAGRYAPHSPEGRRLIAHELAHTIQQGRPAPRRSAAASRRRPRRRGRAAAAGRRMREQVLPQLRRQLRSAGRRDRVLPMVGHVKNGCICIPAEQPACAGRSSSSAR